MNRIFNEKDGTINLITIYDCRDCSFYDRFLEKCKYYNDNVFYDEATDSVEPCKECAICGEDLIDIEV